MASPTETILQIDLMQLLQVGGSAIVAVIGLVIGFSRLLLSQFEKRMDERFDAQDRMRESRLEMIERNLSTESQRIQLLTEKIDAAAARMPMEYVRRDDWIRFSSTIDAKLDRLNEKFDNLRERRNGP